MDGHMKSINNAYENYLAAANAVLATYPSDATKKAQALVKFTEERIDFLSACISADSFIITMKGRNKELEAADKTEAIEMGLGHLCHLRNLLTSSEQTVTSCITMMVNQDLKLDKVRKLISWDELLKSSLNI